MDKDPIHFYREHRSQKLIPGAEVPERMEYSHSLSGEGIPEGAGVCPEIFPLVTGGKFHSGFLFTVSPLTFQSPPYFLSILSRECSEHLHVRRVLPSEHTLVLFSKDFSKNPSGEAVPQ